MDISTTPTKKEVIADGIYPAILNERYHETSAVSSSIYKSLFSEGTMLHVWASWVCGNASKGGNALRLGSAIHLAFEGVDAWSREIVIKPSDRQRRSNADKEWWAAFEAEHAGKTLVTQQEADNAWRCAQSALKHPWLKHTLGGGDARREHSFYRTLPGMHQERVRPDTLVIAPDGASAIHIDYKSTISAQRTRFERQAANLFYDLSAVMYTDLLSAALGIPVHTYWFAVEKTFPWAGRPVEPDLSATSRGASLLSEARAAFAQSLATNRWPGFAASPIAVGIPRYAQTISMRSA